MTHMGDAQFTLAPFPGSLPVLFCFEERACKQAYGCHVDEKSTQIYSHEINDCCLPVDFLFIALANPLLNVFMHRLAFSLKERENESW